MYKLTNVIEVFVFDLMDSILKTKTEMCTCDKCKADIAAVALNQLKPRYVTSQLGDVITRTEIMDSDLRTAIVVSLTEAVELVAKSPRHGRD